MDFQFTEDIDLMRKAVRDFVQDKVEAVAMEIEDNDEIRIVSFNCQRRSVYLD